MPLKSGSSKKAISYNIAELLRSGHIGKSSKRITDPKQAAAIAYSKAGKSRKKKGLD